MPNKTSRQPKSPKSGFVLYLDTEEISTLQIKKEESMKHNRRKSRQETSKAKKKYKPR